MFLYISSLIQAVDELRKANEAGSRRTTRSRHTKPVSYKEPDTPGSDGLEEEEEEEVRISYIHQK